MAKKLCVVFGEFCRGSEELCKQGGNPQEVGQCRPCFARYQRIRDYKEVDEKGGVLTWFDSLAGNNRTPKVRGKPDCPSAPRPNVLAPGGDTKEDDWEGTKCITSFSK